MARRSTEAVLRFEIDKAHALLEKARDALDRANEAFAMAGAEVRRMEEGVRDARARHDRAEAALAAFLPAEAPEQLPLTPAQQEMSLMGATAEQIAALDEPRLHPGHPGPMIGIEVALGEEATIVALGEADAERIAAEDEAQDQADRDRELADREEASARGDVPEEGPEGDERTRLRRRGSRSDA